MTKSTSKLWALLTVMVAVLVGLAMAPLSHGQAMQSQQSQSAQSQSISATGCLQRSSSGSGYQLTDQASNKTYDLSASSSDVDLSAHVGHTVTVTGTSSGASGESSSSAASNPSSSTGSGSTGSSSTGTSGTGTSGSMSGTGTGATGSSSSTPAETITVTNVKMVSSSCQQ